MAATASAASPGIQPAKREGPQEIPGSAVSFPAGKTPELSAPGRGCAYSVFRACASPLVSPGCRTKNQRSPNKLRQKRPMQNPFRKVFILLCLDPHRPDQQICAFYLYSAEKAERARKTVFSGLPTIVSRKVNRPHFLVSYRQLSVLTNLMSWYSWSN